LLPLNQNIILILGGGLLYLPVGSSSNLILIFLEKFGLLRSIWSKRSIAPGPFNIYKVEKANYQKLPIQHNPYKFNFINNNEMK
jgi:hypothetical protein